VNEFALIERYFSWSPRSPSVVLGVGDDAAILAPSAGCEIVATVDMLVEGRHFFAATDPRQLGHKTLAVNLSDLAAMGARPRWALLAGALPAADDAWLASFAAGFHALADEFAVDLVGGDTTRGPRNLCVTVLGEVPAGAALRRDGAKPGDDIYVSGALGDAALAVAVIEGRAVVDDRSLRAARERLESPQPRIALGLALRGVASAAIDVSDGLTGDLGHVLRRSHLGAEIDLAAIPRSAALAAKLAGPEREFALACLLAGGDDYELLFTAPVTAASRVAAIAVELKLPLTRIGTITRGASQVIVDERGTPLSELPRAYDHFARSE
jgi:thiamine-monophosphate kinase